jgi:PAS domain S-box-containing protein
MARVCAEVPPSAEAAARLWTLSSDLMTVAASNGDLLLVNDAWTRVLGWTAAELLHENFLEFVHPDDLQITRAELERLRSGLPTEKFENRLRTKAGEYRQVAWRASPSEDQFYAIGRDITERLKREEALRHAQKMEVLGQLTGGIAHDFNNLLTVIRSAIEFLNRPDLSPERRARYLRAISDASDRAMRVTGQLLAFARRQRLEPEVFEVRERLGDLSELLREMVGASVTITTIVPDQPCWIAADLIQFETALMNLAINARDAMQGEGSLEIEVAAANQVPPIRGHASTTGEFIAISMKDSGSGISTDQLTLVFDPFFTTKGPTKGTGLGLSQVYGFVRQSGGNVEVRSELGAGAQFTIYLPRSHPGSETSASDASLEPAHVLHNPRVLLVEDNEQVGEFSLGMLQDLGFEAVWAKNSAEALAMLEADHESFHIIFSDVVMSGMSGLELAEIVKQRWPGLRVLLTSGFSSALARDGASGFRLLKKPYSADELSRALKEELARASG